MTDKAIWKPPDLSSCKRTVDSINDLDKVNVTASKNGPRVNTRSFYLVKKLKKTPKNNYFKSNIPLKDTENYFCFFCKFLSLIVAVIPYN